MMAKDSSWRDIAGLLLLAGLGKVQYEGIF